MYTRIEQSIFRNQNMVDIIAAVKMMSISSLVAAAILSVFYVAGEGNMICYLLKGVGEKARLLRCIAYSFIGLNTRFIKFRQSFGGNRNMSSRVCS